MPNAITGKDRRPSIVFTNPARCKDCYRCVRVCPVKAIRVEAGQASVDGDRCIHCGSCVRQCPQKAKAWRNDVERARRLTQTKRVLAASIAPSFAGFFKEWEWKRLPSALRLLGFSHVSETAVGAWHSARKTAEWIEKRPERAWIESSCPAVVAYVEKYAPRRVRNLTPVLSPMRTHAALLKEKLGADAGVVFIGPCVAKKAEAEREDRPGLVDAALTFAELTQWLEEEKIDLSLLEESAFDEKPAGEARCFPLLGGCMQTAKLGGNGLSTEVFSASGFAEIKAVLDLENTSGLRLIECLFCPEGCVGGPAIPQEGNPFERRQRLLHYAGGNKEDWGDAPNPASVSLEACFKAQPVDVGEPVPEELIRIELEKTGKADTENQLNCGACGYSSCREKSLAVIRGMAEAEMCLPHMRRLAEGRSDRIMETSPNGILIVDGNLGIVAMNPAFRGLFYCSDAILGRHVGCLMDPDPFERLLSGREARVESVVEHKQYNRICHQILYRLERENQYVGIFVNVTERQRGQAELERLRADAMVQARELFEHQLRTAQEMTRFLGENAARGEALVEKLVELVGEGNDNARGTDRRGREERTQFSEE
jgi:iron only hydrogenase large subunit-like protein/uncharacterized Fe-S cluster-containing protein